MFEIGYSLIPTPQMVKSKLRYGYRTWKQRLFTLPFQPFKKMAFYTSQVPLKHLIVDEQFRNVYGHPSVIQNLRDSLVI